MKKFLFKGFLFIIPLLISILIFDYYMKDFIFNDELERKISVLIKNKDEVNIIIAGDSRAERQVIPNIIEHETGLKTVNIATTACDLITLYKAFKKYEFLNNDKITLIVSTSIFQVNDGAIDTGYISYACIAEMSIIEKLIMFNLKLKELLLVYKNMISQAIATKKENFSLYDNDKINKGFSPFGGNIKLPINIKLDTVRTQHEWYKNLNIAGTRWKIFKKALYGLSKKKCNIIIYQPPVSPVWKNYTRNSFIDKAEQNYSKNLSNEIANYKNIKFIDYYNNVNTELIDDMYYDIQHLNDRGAGIFTKILLTQLKHNN
jgi:hypothetical protein